MKTRMLIALLIAANIVHLHAMEGPVDLEDGQAVLLTVYGEGEVLDKDTRYDDDDEGDAASKALLEAATQSLPTDNVQKPEQEKEEALEQAAQSSATGNSPETEVEKKEALEQASQSPQPEWWLQPHDSLLVRLGIFAKKVAVVVAKEVWQALTEE